jgi:NADH-quinone oxidoreductase subunit L
MDLSQSAWLIPLLPLGGFLANFLFLRGSRRGAPLLATAAVGLALVLSLGVAWSVVADPAPRECTLPWLSVTNQIFGHFTISVGTLVDPLSAMMLVVVTTVSFLVHIYSLGYMHDEKGLVRFFMYLGLFTFSMLGLVLSPGLFQMYVFWELVGLCSYLLIGFYIEKPEANQACKKAFVVNRVGDLGMFLGILFLTYYLGASDFRSLPGLLGRWPLYAPAWLPLGAVALLLFCGAVGKSAQFPLHVWLPDAMEGPTPVSALIHAATMVAAGVFMVARTYAVFDAALLSSVDAAQVVAWVGAFTSVFAATIACTQFDIKRVLAYSTLSQLGYMVLALGVGGLGVTAGAFHLFTHAFFKALLFLGAGSAIHAVHSNDLRSMGGLRRFMPVTAITFLVACLAISGIFPLAGFFSKDMIFDALRESHQTALAALAMGVAFLTAFYMFRLYFLAFEGEAPKHGHPHESPKTMTGPLVALAVLSCVAGFAGLDWNGHGFGNLIRFDRAPSLTADWSRAQALAQAHPGVQGDFRRGEAVWNAAVPAPAQGVSAAHTAPRTDSAQERESRSFKLDWAVALPATAVALAGILLAFLFYRARWIDPAKVVGALGPIHRIVYNKYYVDEAYRFLLDHGYYVISAAILWFDRHVVDGVMNGFAWLMQALGGHLRRLQNGSAQVYALGTAAGVLAVFATLWVFR